MSESLYKLFTEQLKLSADLWLIVLLCVVVLAFVVSLLIGLLTGRLKQIKGAMRFAVSKPTAAVGAMKQMPQSIKTQYKNARMGNIKPSILITEQVCVGEPYKRSFISKVWIITALATLICAGIAQSICALAPIPEDAEEAAVIALRAASLTAPVTILLVGGLLTVIGGIIGKCVYGGSVKLYEKFAPVMDGDLPNAAAHMQAQNVINEEPQAQPMYAEAQAQPAYAEPQAQPMYEEAQAQPVYAEPQAEYVEPQTPVYEQAPPVVNVTPQESEEEQRRRAREEALAQARAQQAAAQAQAARVQAQAQAQPAAAADAGSSSVDAVIAQIDNIERNGATREAMREVATQLQKERAKPENKTPERQKRLNEALSKLLKAMSAASRK